MKKIEVSKKELTQVMALRVAVFCVRNTIIEEYHGQGKLTDRDMKAFNKEVVNKLYTFFQFFFGVATHEEIDALNRLMEFTHPSGWDTPKLDQDIIKGVEQLTRKPISFEN